MPKASKKARARHPGNPWSQEEVVLAVFLRSRRLKDRQIVAVLNGRYAPKVRHLGALRTRLKVVRDKESEAGRIDLTYDRYFTYGPNVDRWIVGQIDDAHARSELFTFTEHELAVMETNRGQLAVNSLLVPGPGQMPTNQETGRREQSLPAVGPRQMSGNQERGRRDESLPVVGPSQMSANQERGGREESLSAASPRQMLANQEIGSREDSLPAVGPSQVLDQRTGQAMTRQSQMTNFSTLNTNERPDQSVWPVWDATLEALFPGLGPPATQGESSLAMQSGAGDERAQDPYYESQEFEEWYDPEGEEGEDEDEEDEVDEDDDGDDAEYRFQRDENDNCWYDEDQEEEDV